MKATVLDTETGERRTSEGIRTFEWEENNWSCDCNRANLFGEDVEFEMDRRMRVQHPDLLAHQSCCWGCGRFLVVAQEPEGDEDWVTTLTELNAGYPVKLLAAHGIANKGNIGKEREESELASVYEKEVVDADLRK